MGLHVSTLVATLYGALQTTSIGVCFTVTYIDSGRCTLMTLVYFGVWSNGGTPSAPQQHLTLHTVHCGDGAWRYSTILASCLCQMEDGSLDITVYRKPKHTDCYPHFNSHYPSHVTWGLVRCLYTQAERITLSSISLSNERKHLHRMLNASGYPSRFISRATLPGYTRSKINYQYPPLLSFV